MPDITMCKEKCSMSEKCYRHEDSGTQPSEHLQSFFLDLSEMAGEECEYFWPTRAKYERRRND